MRYEKSFVSADEVFEFIVHSELSEQELEKKDVQKVLDLLRFDGLIEAKLDPSTRQERYKVTHTPPQAAYLQMAPCGMCPVRSLCTHSPTHTHTHTNTHTLTHTQTHTHTHTGCRQVCRGRSHFSDHMYIHPQVGRVLVCGVCVEVNAVTVFV